MNSLPGAERMPVRAALSWEQQIVDGIISQVKCQCRKHIYAYYTPRKEHLRIFKVCFLPSKNSDSSVRTDSGIRAKLDICSSSSEKEVLTFSGSLGKASYRMYA